MACYLFDAQLFYEPMLDYFELDTWEKIQCNQNKNSFAFENVFCKIVAICLGINVLITDYSKSFRKSFKPGASLTAYWTLF